MLRLAKPIFSTMAASFCACPAPLCELFPDQRVAPGRYRSARGVGTSNALQITLNVAEIENVEEHDGSTIS